MHLFNSVSDELAIIYLARGLQLGKSNTEETEQLQLRKMPFKKRMDWYYPGRLPIL